MKLTKPTIITAAIVTAISLTGVAAAYSDIQIIPGTRPAGYEKPVYVAPEHHESKTESSTPPENENSDNLNSETNTTTPLVNSQTNTETEVINEPTPEVEFDPTPEPLPAPATNITNVENTNTGVGNNTPGNVSVNQVP